VFIQIGNRGHTPLHEGLDRHNIFDAHAHRMPSETFGVSNHNLIGFTPKSLTQGMDFRCGTAAARRGISLVRHEHHFGGEI